MEQISTVAEIRPKVEYLKQAIQEHEVKVLHKKLQHSLQDISLQSAAKRKM